MITQNPLHSLNDTERLKNLVRTMLDRLEKTLEAEQESGELFSGRNSLSSVLVALAGLMLKLNESESLGKEAMTDIHVFDAVDIALIEEFLKKTQPI